MYQPTVKLILGAGWVPGDGTMDGAQLVDGEWYHPLAGCDSLQYTVDSIRRILLIRQKAKIAAEKLS